MYEKSTEAELRQLCKERIESLEHWLHRLIDQTFSLKFGDYFSHVDDKGDRLISGQIVRSIEKRKQGEPRRYGRLVDAILLEDAIDIICNPRHYPLFSPALGKAFPQGAEVARTYLLRILEPRNCLAHANAISVRHAEQVVCYSNDIIASIKSQYQEIGMHQDFNVPSILKYVDSLGNTRHRNQFTEMGGAVMVNFSEDPLPTLRPGEVLSFELEVDAAFESDQYSIELRGDGLRLEKTPSGCKGIVTLTSKHVSETRIFEVVITSKQEWHRFGGHDDTLFVAYRVLPPMR